MKKIVMYLTAAVMAACAMAAPAFAATGVPDFTPVYALGDDLSLYEKGDVNLDGEVNAKDGNIILAEYANYTVIHAEHRLNEDQLAFADVVSVPDETSTVNPMDVNVVLHYSNCRLIGYDYTMDEFLEIWKNNREAAVKASDEAAKL